MESSSLKDLFEKVYGKQKTREADEGFIDEYNDSDDYEDEEKYD